MLMNKIRPLVLGVLFGASLVTTPVNAAGENPFGITPIENSRLILAAGKCGAGKCGGSSKSTKGSCMKGMKRMDSNGDGNISKEEFMNGHEAMFDKIDTNGDGIIDESERAAHMKKMKGS